MRLLHRRKFTQKKGKKQMSENEEDKNAATCDCKCNCNCCDGLADVLRKIADAIGGR